MKKHACAVSVLLAGVSGGAFGGYTQSNVSARRVVPSEAGSFLSRAQACVKDDRCACLKESCMSLPLPWPGAETGSEVRQSGLRGSGVPVSVGRALSCC